MEFTTRSIEEYLTWELAFSIPTIVGLVVVCAAVMAWALFRERRVLGTRSTLGFGLLRTVALATAVFMLLGPTSVIEESTKTNRAIAVMTDISASMTTVDPPGAADDLRWAASQIATVRESPLGKQLAATDRAIVSLSIAQRSLVNASSIAQAIGAPEELSQQVVVADRAFQRARRHRQQIAELSDEAIQPYLARITTLFEGPEFDSLSELSRTLQRGKTPRDRSWREGLNDLVARNAALLRVLNELAGKLAESGQATLLASGTSGKAFQHQSRSERVASLLERLHTEAFATESEAADWRWSVFDETGKVLSAQDAIVRFADQLSEQEQLSKRTDLSGALNLVHRMKNQQPIAATLLFTDAAHNHEADQSPIEVATQIKDSPVYVVPIGNPSRLRDVDLVSVSAPAVAMRNDNVVIEAKLEFHQCDGETCVVQLLSDGEVVDFRNVLVEADSTIRTVRFDQRVANIGTASFQISAEPLDGELSADNNFDEVEINVTRSDIKVLLADELPRWEYRYLAQLFRRDPKVELDELLHHPRQIATGRRAESRSLPVNADDWNHYDVVILGDLPTEHFSAASQTALVDYLRTRGGTVILIAGDRAMPESYVDFPLLDVLPVEKTTASDRVEGYSLKVTEQGRSHVALMISETQESTRQSWEFVNRFSPLHHVSPWRVPLPTANTLIASVPRGTDALDDERDANTSIAESAFLCWQQVGRGRLIYLSGPDTYRLRFLRGDRLHYRFWGQLMRWAIAADMGTGSERIRIRTSRTSYETDQTVDIEVELKDTDGSAALLEEAEDETLGVRLRHGDEERLLPLDPDKDRPGVYRAQVRSLPPGVYQAIPAGPIVDSLASDLPNETLPEDAVASFTVQAKLPTELVDTRVNRVLAGQIAELTGGQVVPPTAIAEVLQLTNLEPVVTHSAQRTPLWLRWKYLLLVFGCLQTEWIIRKWRGLS